jgi:hypothetical protein
VNFLKKIAPFISTGLSLAGPYGAIAGKLLSPILGVKPDAKPDEMAAAIAGATPEQIEAIRKAEQDFQLQMKQLDIQSVDDLEKIAADDRASARNREIQVKDNTPRILAYVYAAGFFLTLGAEIWMAVSGVNINPLASKSIDILLGVLTGMVLGTKEYYFGSSAGSDKKTDLLGDIVKG